MLAKAPKVLIIDDDVFYAREYVHALTDEGFEVSLAPTATAGYELARTGIFAVILLDVMMEPGDHFNQVETAGGLETGLSIARRLLTEQTGSKIVLFTNSSSSSIPRWASERGNVSYLNKKDIFSFELAEHLRGLLDSEGHRLGGRNPSKGSTMKRLCDVAILTALPKELDAVLAQHDGWATVESKTSVRNYYRATLGNGLVAVAANALGMGQLNAAMMTADVLAEWNPFKILLVGIAAGLGPEVRLGDVVVSEQIVDYELGKVTNSGLTPRWSVYRSDPALMSSLHSFLRAGWTGKAIVRRPDDRPATETKSHIGVVLSGNKVIADEETAGALKSVWQRAAAIEMESAGICAALYQRRETVGFMMFKGICDKADAAKDDSWQGYAASAAASFSWQFLETLTRSAVFKITPENTYNEFGVPSRALRLALAGAFNLAELKILASDLEVDWDDIAGETKSEKIVELISYLKRRRRLEELVKIVRSDRSELLQSFLSD